MGRHPDQHLPGLRSLFETCGDIDRVASRQPLLRAGHHLTRVHPDPAADPQFRQRVPHLDSRAAGAERVVLVRAGTPNTAITASPMNFSTVPPCDSTIAFIRSKYRASNARTASGSVDSPSAVEPATSQNNTVTVLRTSRRAAAVASAALQPLQKRASTGFSRPQLAQIITGPG